MIAAPARLVERRLGAASGGARWGGCSAGRPRSSLPALAWGASWSPLRPGLSTASLFDPETGEETTVLGRLYGWIALAVFLALDGPLILIRALIESYRAVPAGRLLISQETAELAFGQVGRALELSLRVAAPPALALTLAGIVLGWLSRAAPSLPFVALALPIRSVFGCRTGHAQPGHVDRHAGERVGRISLLTEDLSCPRIGRNRHRSGAGNWHGSTGRLPHSPELTAAAGWLAAVVLLGIMGDDLAVGPGATGGRAADTSPR